MNVNLTLSLESAVLTIQSAYRSHVAQNRFIKLQLRAIKNIFHADYERQLANALQLAEKVNNVGQQYITLSQTVDIATTIEDLNWLGNKISTMRDNLLTQYEAIIPSRQAINDYRKTHNSNLLKIKFHSDLIAQKIGYATILKSLSENFGESWQTRVSQEALQSINDFNMIFRPSAYKILRIKKTKRKHLYCLIDQYGNTCKRLERKIALNLPFLQELTLFSPQNIVEEINAAELYIPLAGTGYPTEMLLLKGRFIYDPSNICRHIAIIRDKLEYATTTAKRRAKVDQRFIDDYLSQYPLKELLLKDEIYIADDVENDFEFCTAIEKRGLTPSFLNMFDNLSCKRQIKILSLLLIKDMTSEATLIYTKLRKINEDMAAVIDGFLRFPLKDKMRVLYENYLKTKEKVKQTNFEPASYKERILSSAMDDAAKAIALNKAKIVDNGNSEADKATKYLDALLKIPFGKYVREKVNRNSPPQEITAYLNGIAGIIDQAVYGYEKPKKIIMEWIAQRISNNSSKGECIALEGPPGTGKTTFAKQGIAKALNRPFVFISMGGETGASNFMGHEYTYEGSEWGKIVSLLMEAQCMNPVFYIDEVDKISETPHGQEIVGLLTSLTDFSQNDNFQDKYFSNIKLDLSRALFIFSYNDPQKLDPVFKDRLTVIKIDPLNTEEKIHIAQNYLLPDISSSCGFVQNEISMETDEIRYIIDNYTSEAGVRKLKENIYAIVRQLNLSRLQNPDSVTLPIKIDKEMIIRYRDNPPITFHRVNSTPRIGIANGLYATSHGMGGLTIIQVHRTPATKRLALTLTGSQGKVMRESMMVAKSVAWNIIDKNTRKSIMRDIKEGLHIHVPKGATPKDGPSAGAAITTAIISHFTGIPVKQNVAMTGEIDLSGKITEIGELEQKLIGAKKAGVTLVIIPEDNQQDLDKIRDKNKELIDKCFQVVTVKNIHEVLNLTLINNPF